MSVAVAMQRINQPSASNQGGSPLSTNALSFQSQLVGEGGAMDIIDPWGLYGGNIAAACQATNESIKDGQQDEANLDEEKKRQRAHNRLTAWQSRERKRIEFEVMQERKTELTRKNDELKKENEQLKLVIQRLKAAKQYGEPSSFGNAASLQVTPMHAHAVAMSNIAARQQQEDLFNILHNNRMRRDLPQLVTSSNQHANLLRQGGIPTHYEVQNPVHNQVPGKEVIGPTVFSPLSRTANIHQQSLSLPYNFQDFSTSGREFEIPYYRTITQQSLKRKPDSSSGSTGVKKTRKDDFPSREI